MQKHAAAFFFFDIQWYLRGAASGGVSKQEGVVL
jgi:hypothetical protein